MEKKSDFVTEENHKLSARKAEKSKGASTMKETKYAGTQTEKNLMTAFAGESEARNKYTYFAFTCTSDFSGLLYDTAKFKAFALSD